MDHVHPARLLGSTLGVVLKGIFNCRVTLTVSRKVLGSSLSGSPPMNLERFSRKNRVGETPPQQWLVDSGNLVKTAVGYVVKA